MPPTITPDCLTVREAAIRLSMTPEALRKHLQRAANRSRSGVRAIIGPGVEGFKIGAAWRVRIAYASSATTNGPDRRESHAGSKTP